MNTVIISVIVSLYEECPPSVLYVYYFSLVRAAFLAETPLKIDVNYPQIKFDNRIPDVLMKFFLKKILWGAKLLSQLRFGIVDCTSRNASRHRSARRILDTSSAVILLIFMK